MFLDRLDSLGQRCVAPEETAPSIALDDFTIRSKLDALSDLIAGNDVDGPSAERPSLSWRELDYVELHRRIPSLMTDATLSPLR
jgi:hypothetical protein